MALNTTAELPEPEWWDGFWNYEAGRFTLADGRSFRVFAVVGHTSYRGITVIEWGGTKPRRGGTRLTIPQGGALDEFCRAVAAVPEMLKAIDNR